MPKKKIVVVGAGFGGLSAAAYLARDGYDVTVLEKNSQPGGRAITMHKKGFTFDMGPSWYMMPDVFDDFFADFGKKTSDYYELKRLSPSYRIYTTTDRHDVRTTGDGGLQLFEDLEPGSSKKLQKLLNKTEKEYDLIRGHILERGYVDFSDLLNPKALQLITKPNLAGPYHSRIKKTVSNEDLQKILEFMVVFMGGSPQNIPAAYSLLAHVDLNLGIWYPMGGFGEVAKAFEKVCKDQGVKIHYNTEVTHVETENHIVKSVHAGDHVFPADVAVMNADYHFAETKLLSHGNQSYSTRYWHTRTLSPSTLLVYLGVSKKVPGLLHHTMFFDADWHGHFDQVFKSKSWVSRPLFYVGTPSKTDPSIAPEGMENIVVLVPVANGLEVDSAHKDELVSTVIARMEARTGTKFAENIIVKEVRDGEFFKQTFNAYKGNAFGLAHTLSQTAPLRPRMQSKNVKNLFYVGQYTNPGTGVPIVVLSGKVVNGLIGQKIGHG